MSNFSVSYMYIEDVTIGFSNTLMIDAVRLLNNRNNNHFMRELGN